MLNSTNRSSLSENTLHTKVRMLRIKEQRVPTYSWQPLALPRTKFSLQLRTVGANIRPQTEISWVEYEHVRTLSRISHSVYMYLILGVESTYAWHNLKHHNLEDLSMQCQANLDNNFLWAVIFTRPRQLFLSMEFGFYPFPDTLLKARLHICYLGICTHSPANSVSSKITLQCSSKGLSTFCKICNKYH